MTSLSLTIDLEDPTGQYAPNGHYVTMTHRLLDLCDETGRRATFFTIGRVATSAPSLIKAIAARGHEIAYHSHDHVSLTEETPARFERESRMDKTIIEQLTGRPVSGFRAPRFSLTPQTKWTIDILGNLGFLYSSSIMPTSLSLFGFPKASQKPFRWPPNGMVEFPLPVASLGPLRVPYLGGVYLYALPAFLVNHWARCADAGEALWTYVHPYDLDTETPFACFPDTPYWICRILWLVRRQAGKKLRHVLELGDAGPLGERVSSY